MSWGAPTKEVLVSFGESGKFARCARCTQPVPGRAWTWQIGAASYCASCVPIAHFTAPGLVRPRSPAA